MASVHSFFESTIFVLFRLKLAIVHGFTRCCCFVVRLVLEPREKEWSFGV
jgi:hypothetical protein